MEPDTSIEQTPGGQATLFEVVSEYDPEAEAKVPIVHQSMDPVVVQAYTIEQAESAEL